MTLPASPNSLAMSQLNVETNRPSTSTISLNSTLVRVIANLRTDRSKIAMSNLRGKSYTIVNNSGILTSASGSFVLPETVGLTISIITIGAGGGGGGGSGRTHWSGYFVGGGGGANGHANYHRNISVTPGQTISYVVGQPGSGGVARDGVYSDGSSGTVGGNSYVTVGAGVYSSSGGNGGTNSPNGAGGTASSNIDNYFTPIAGGQAYNGSSTQNEFNSQQNGNTEGGVGAYGYSINTTVGAAIYNMLGETFVYGTGGGPEFSGIPAVTGGGYGAGGGGGGCAQSDRGDYRNMFSANGAVGAVFVWWGY
jgi:hypothetical protein